MKRFMLIFCMLLIAGCAEITDETDFKGAVDALEAVLDSEDWQLINEKVTAIEEQYSRSKWKLQLLGDEDEYESLQESVNHLKTAAKSKDKSECEKELTTIRTYLDQIYSL